MLMVLILKINILKQYFFLKYMWPYYIHDIHCQKHYKPPGIKGLSIYPCILKKCRTENDTSGEHPGDVLHVRMSYLLLIIFNLMSINRWQCKSLSCLSQID